MNNRRIFLTKDEVKSLGTELTAQTTDDIAILYLPIDFVDMPETYTTIYFKYRTLNHTDYTYSYTGSGYKININNNISTNNKCVSISLYRWESGRSSSHYMTFRFNRGKYGNSAGTMELYPCEYDLAYPDDGESSSRTSHTHMPITYQVNTSDLYVRVDITKIKFPSYAGNCPAFLIQYVSGDIPADTIFYEPYED